MAIDEKNLRRLAKFFYKHRTYKAWWVSPHLLTRPELQSFGLTIDEAEEVFRAFEDKGFLRRDGENRQTVLGHDFQKYRFVLAHEGELRKFAKLPFWYSWVSVEWSDRIERLVSSVSFWIVVAISALIGGVLTKWGEQLYDWTRTLLSKVSP